MADREVVVKMPEEMYNWVFDANKNLDDYGVSDFWELIENGTLLPKGHDRLIYAKDVGEYLTLADVPTIIEADKNEPLYKKGDIILKTQGNLVFVVKDTGIDLVVVNNKDALENENSWMNVIEYNEIERKMGNIYDE